MNYFFGLIQVKDRNIKEPPQNEQIVATWDPQTDRSQEKSFTEKNFKLFLKFDI